MWLPRANRFAMLAEEGYAGWVVTQCWLSQSAGDVLSPPITTSLASETSSTEGAGK